MGDYEENQKRVQALWQEMLSDEENDPVEDLLGDVYLSDGYETENSSVSSEEDVAPRPKKRKKFDKLKNQSENIPTTSIQKVTTARLDIKTQPIPSTSKEHVDETLLKSIEETIEKFILDESDSEAEDTIVQEEITWGPPTGHNLNQNIYFNATNSGISAAVHEEYYDKKPYDFYRLLINDSILDLIVQETNRYATQCQAENVTPGSRIKSWKPTNAGEIEYFIGILMWMGLCQLPAITSYWSNKIIYNNQIKSIMPRNRFQLLLKMLHFSNNDDENVEDDRLRKITPLLDLLNQSFQSVLVPGEYVCIDETLVPFKGRLKFKQYISNKRHKFGIKLFKLCQEGGYTYNFKVYCGKESDKNSSVPSKVVISLMDGLLNEGRTLCTDNYYTSVSLAHELLKKKTHLIGTLRSNRKLNPKSVVEKKLKKGESVAEESNTGVLVQKWRDKRDLLMLSTRYSDEMIKVQKRNVEIEKPKTVIEYNKYKAYIDISDQLKSYNTSLRRGVKWYRKLSIELMLGTALVNAYFLHQNVAFEKMSITSFKEEIIEAIFSEKFRNIETGNEETELTSHRLDDRGRNGRRRCVNCYSKSKIESGRKHAMGHTTRTSLICVQCNKFYCLNCFFETHQCTV